MTRRLMKDTFLLVGIAGAAIGLGYYFFASDPSAQAKAKEMEARAKGLTAEARGKVSFSQRYDSDAHHQAHELGSEVKGKVSVEPYLT